MKTIYSENVLGAVVAMAMAAWLPLVATGADEPVKPLKGSEHPMMMEGKMMEHCKAMKEQKEKMMADMRAQDAALTAQVAEMNSAPEKKKLDLMSAIVTHMVKQQSAMNARKAKMEEAMMQHMMGHMQMGKESMSQCPMMKGMKGMDGKAPDAHKEHHEEQK